MEKYESKQQQIRRSAEQIYAALSSFSNFTPMLQDKVEEWQADEDSCSFKVKGMTLRLRIVEREVNKTIKATSLVLWISPFGCSSRRLPPTIPVCALCSTPS